MKQINLESRAKINLGLDVLGKRDDGYHNIKTIMQEIGLKDRLRVEKIDKNFIIETNVENMPLDDENIVAKVWQLMKARYNLEGGIKVHIEKNIPIAAGLAGGSANGAATLKAINLLWDLGLTSLELQKLGLEIGADLPFCLVGGSLLAQGIGEDFSSLDSFSGVDILLVNPNFPLSTPEVYKGLTTYGKGEKIDRLVNSMDLENLEKLSGKLYNIMEENILRDYPEIGQIKDMMKKLGALDSLMSGSGPTVFGIFNNSKDLDFAYDKFKSLFKDYIIIKTKTV